MIDGLRRRKARVQRLLLDARSARSEQHLAGQRVREGAIGWFASVETLAWLGVTGYVWGARVNGNRRSDEDLRPMRELAAAGWVVLSWRRLPERIRRMVHEFDPANSDLVVDAPEHLDLPG